MDTPLLKHTVLGRNIYIDKWSYHSIKITLSVNVLMPMSVSHPLGGPKTKYYGAQIFVMIVGKIPSNVRAIGSIAILVKNQSYFANIVLYFSTKDLTEGFQSLIKMIHINLSHQDSYICNIFDNGYIFGYLLDRNRFVFPKLYDF